MSDLAILIHNLESRLPDLRREMTGDDWAAFTRLLVAAAPFFDEAAADPDARLEALYRLRHACIQFPATRGVLPAPGGLIPEPKPAPAQPEPVPGLPEARVAQRDPDVLELMRRAGQLCRHPDEVADRVEDAASPPPAQE